VFVCVCVCVFDRDLETSIMRGPWPALGHSATGKKKRYFIIMSHRFQQAPLKYRVFHT
jgi:hypothetical protein